MSGFSDLNTLSFFIAVVVAITIHEFAHAWMANRLGDPTARLEGRLTLNPIKHLDPLGTLVMVVSIFAAGMGFGWGRPVPVNPYNLKHKNGDMWVSLAGPFSNFILALLIALVFALIPATIASSWSLDFINLIRILISVNVALGIFNLLPIPPLDGSKVLFALLPPGKNEIRTFLERYSLIIFFFLIFFGLSILGQFSRFIVQIIWLLANLINSFIY